MLIKKIIALILSCFFISGFNNFNTWQEIDKQDAPYIQLYYEGRYDKAYPLIERKAESGDITAQYTLAKMYDFGTHWINCGTLRKCLPTNFGPIDDFDFSKSKAKLWYNKAINNGHPYAAYMLTNHITKGHKPLPDKNKQQAKEDLLPRVEAGDGVATYMYYELTSYTFAITAQTTKKSNQNSKQNLEMIIELLLKEAKQGRVLAMHYLGRAYYNLWDYPKSFAWFTLASKSGHSPSGIYQKMVIAFIEKEGLEKDTLRELNTLLAEMTDKK